MTLTIKHIVIALIIVTINRLNHFSSTWKHRKSIMLWWNKEILLLIIFCRVSYFVS